MYYDGGNRSYPVSMKAITVTINAFPQKKAKASSKYLLSFLRWDGNPVLPAGLIYEGVSKKPMKVRVILLVYISSLTHRSAMRT